MPVAKLLSRVSIPIGVVAGGLSIALFSAPAAATLHGYCAPATTECIDNGTNSPTTMNPPVNFGFTTSPGPSSGDLFVDVLVPNNNPLTPGFALTGTLPGTATLFSSTAWTSGQLDAYLGLPKSTNPANPIGGYLTATQALDPAASGFFVYQVDLGHTTLQGTSNPNMSPLEHLSPGVPIASYIVGFFNEGTAANPNFQATANSGAIFVTSGPSTVPEPASLLLLVTGLAGLGISRRRRRT